MSASTPPAAAAPRRSHRAVNYSSVALLEDFSPSQLKTGPPADAAAAIAQAEARRRASGGPFAVILERPWPLSAHRRAARPHAEVAQLFEAAQRHYALQGELLQCAVVVPAAFARNFPWIAASVSAAAAAAAAEEEEEEEKEEEEEEHKVAEEEDEVVRFCPLPFEVDVQLRGVDEDDQSVLSHYLTDSHSSPAREHGSAPPRAECAVLPASGDVVVLLEFIVSVSNAYVAPELCLDVTFSPVSSTLEAVRGLLDARREGPGDPTSLLRQLSLENSFESLRHKPVSVQRLLQVVQPLQVTSRDALVGAKVCLNVCVENVHEQLSVDVEDLEVHLNRTRYTLKDSVTELATIPLERFFKLYAHTEELPITLAPGEQHNFVMFVESLRCSPAELSQLSDRLSTLFSVRWSCPVLSHPVLLQQKVHWAKPAQENVMVSLRCVSPVPLHTRFTVYVTVTNWGDDVHHLTMLIAPPQADAADQLLCLETSVELGTLPPEGRLSTSLHFIAMREGLLEMNDLLLFDKRVGAVVPYRISETPTVFAQQS